MTIFDKDGNIDDHRRPGARRGNNKDRWEAYCVFRELLWKAVDENDKDFSIVETQIALGLYERKK